MNPTLRSSALIMMMTLTCGTVLAQRSGPQFRRQLACEPLEPRTRLEAIEGGYGKVLIKGFTHAVVSVRGADIRVDAIELKDASSATWATGIVIVMREKSERATENRAYIDYEEIDLFLRALDTLSKVTESVTKLAGFEARYRTSGDLEIAVFRQSRISGTAASLSSGICDRVTGLLTLDELDRLRAHITEAKTRLDETR
jgi:hypothetical protein